MVWLMTTHHIPPEATRGMSGVAAPPIPQAAGAAGGDGGSAAAQLPRRVPPRRGGPGTSLPLRARPTSHGYMPWISGSLDQQPLAVLQLLLAELRRL